MAASYVKYTAAIEPLMEAINAGSDAYKFALALTVNVADTSFVAGTTDLATAGGYTAGGNAATVASAAQTAGTYKLVLNPPAVWTASAGGFTFRYVILWDTTTSTPLAYWDTGVVGGIAMNGSNADTFTFTPDASAGVFQAT